MSAPTFDTNWEDHIYKEGKQLNRWPYDAVVSFVFQHRPRDKRREDTRILEVGCGAGNNLWFAAREGFRVAGVDGSATAVDAARKRFAEERVDGDLRVADFTKLPFEDNSFDLVFDRGALSCCGKSDATEAIAEVRRVLVKGGRFLFNPYSDRHSLSMAGDTGPDGLRLAFREGHLQGVWQLAFYSGEEIGVVLGQGWTLITRDHSQIERDAPEASNVAAWWIVVAKL